MIRIILCDDHKIVRAGLKEILNDCADMKVIAEAGTGEDLLKLLHQADADIILLDVSLPGRSGLEILKQVKLLYPDLPVLILSTHKEEQYAFRTIKADASGYLHKDSEPDELIKAIRTVSSGKKYLSQKLANVLLTKLQKEDVQNSHETLSDREYEVMLLLATGKSVSQIASVLSISPNTVSTYKSRVMEKMNFNSNADLFQYVKESNLSPG